MKELWTQDEAEYHGTYYDFPPVRSFPKPAQKPHPPIYLGGKARNAFNRIVSWGDGWMPNRTSAEEIRQGRNRLTELAEQAGRDPNSIDILAFGHAGHFKSRDQVQELQEAGANRVKLWLEQTEGDGALAEMEAIARQVV
jgi:alkanesulfonate monooxygenase SsuD/methylene tetrahydromethanopterin reductase-like flavin-dependent oxidoreductase (luciferase family)